MVQIKKYVRFGLRAINNPRSAIDAVRQGQEKREINRLRRERYVEWFAKHELSADDLEMQKSEADALAFRPLISILVPTYNTDPTHLRECFDSVIAQTYSNWELCVSDDASTSEATKAVIREYEARYPNVRAHFSEENTHIAVSSNKALALAGGEFISLLDHDDLLQPNALYETARVLNDHPDADLVYSDEDKLSEEGVHIEPFFKPAWSPDFLTACNYITHFATLSARVMAEVNGFRAGTHGAQDWDLFLRVTDVTDKIHHVPKVLYTWRKSETSTASSSDSKPYAYINQGKVLRNWIEANGQNSYAESTDFMGFWRVRNVIESRPLVSIVIPTKDSFELIRQCVDSILERTSYPNFEIVIVDTGSSDDRVEKYYSTIVRDNPRVNIARWHGTFNFSDACNFGAEAASGEYLLFLNNDTEVITHAWIQGMLEHAQQPGVGMVGAKLLFESGAIQHAGVVLSERDVAFHPFYGQRELIDIFTFIFSNNIRTTSAVTAACSMVARSKFDEVGGFDSALRVTYNDVDLCLRLGEAGYRCVYTPFVHLYHYESMSVGRIETDSRDQSEFQAAKALMQTRWSEKLVDPFYSPAFEQHGPGYILQL